MKNRKLTINIAIGIIAGTIVSQIIIFMWKEGIWLDIFRWLWWFYEGLLFALAAVALGYVALHYIDKIKVDER